MNLALGLTRYRLQACLTFALIAPAIHSQTIPFTESGPFWRHVVKFATIGGCKLTINGQPYATNTVITDKDTVIRFHEDCSAAGASQSFDGTITPSVPPDMPVAATNPPSTYFQLPAGAVKTSMVLDTTMTPTATRDPNSTFDLAVQGTYGASASASCDSKSDSKKAQPKGGVKSTITFACDNQLVYKSSSSQPHGFADGNDSAQIELRFTITGSENWKGSTTSAGYLELDIVSEYKMAPPKMQFSPNPLKLSGPSGQASAASGVIQVKNIGGGLLDFNFSSPTTYLLIPAQSGGGSGTATATPSPTRMTGIMPGTSTPVTVTVDTTSVTKDGAFTTTLVFRSANASNGSVYGKGSDTVPITFTTGVASSPDSVQISSSSSQPSAPLPPGASATFTASMQYQLGSAPQASIKLEVWDAAVLSAGGSSPLGSSSTSITKDKNSAGPLTVSVTVPQTAQNIQLRAVLFDGSGKVLATSGTVDYSVASVADLSIHHMELVQVNTGPPGSNSTLAQMYSGKPTVLRVFVQQVGENDNPFTNISATVTAQCGSDPSGSPTPGLPEAIAPMVVIGRKASDIDRTLQHHSLNFLLPDAWTRQPSCSFTAELVVPPNRPEGPKDNNKQTLTSSFIQSPFGKGQLRIARYDVCVNGKCPDDSVLKDRQAFFEKTLPANPDTVSYSYAGKINYPDVFNDLAALIGLTTLPSLYTQDGRQLLLNLLDGIAPQGRFVLGLFPDDPANDISGEAIGFSSLRADDNGNLAPPKRTLILSDSRSEDAPRVSTLAHEMGHLSGMYHTQTADSCGQSDQGKRTTLWPYDTAAMRDPGYDIGEGLLGLDARFISATTADVMSYCDPRFMSAWSYKWIAGFLDAFAPSFLAAPAAPQASEYPKRRLARVSRGNGAPVITISGYVSKDGSAGALFNTYPSSSDLLSESLSSAPYCIQLSTASGVASQNCFNLDFTGTEGKALTRNFFTRILPLPPGLTQVNLTANGNQLASLQGGGTPSVSFTSPQAGAQLQGIQQIQWSGADSAGAPLTYVLDYSPDGGTTWNRVLPSTTATSATLDMGSIVPSTNASFRVTASNGLSNASAMLGPIAIVQNPQYSPAQNPIDFGNVQIAQDSVFSLPIQNGGDGLLILSAPQVSGGEFSASMSSTTATASLPAGIDIHFRPLTTGLKVGSLTFSTNDPNNPTVTIPLRGAAFDSSITVTPMSLDFGSVAAQASKTMTISIGSLGGGTLLVKSVTVSGSQAFSVVSPALPAVADNGVTFTIGFNPAAAGPQTATLTIASNDLTRPTINVPLTGTGASGGSCPGGPISTTLTVMGSGTSTSGNISASGPLTLSGVGTGTFSSNFSLASAAVSGSVPVTFTVSSGSPTGTLTGTLTGSPALLAQVIAGNPSSSGPVTITITAGTGGFAGATGTFNATASGTGAGTTGSGAGNFKLSGPGTINLPASSCGGGGTPTISVSVPVTDFGDVNTGSTKDLTVTIANTGSAGTVLSVTPSIAPNPPFSIVGSPAALSINAGTQLTLTVRFSPTATGPQTATLTLISTDATTPTKTVTLTGNGIIPQTDPSIIRSLVHHEITRFAKDVRFSNGFGPVLSASGNRIVYFNAPGDETDDRYNDIFVVNADGTGLRRVDSYKQNCSCGAIVDISADGNTIVSTQGSELHLATATGSSGKTLIGNREIPYLRISPRGDKVFFINRRTTSATDPKAERGVYVINADGTGLAQIAGPSTLAKIGVTVDPNVFATNGWSLDVSADGSKVVFGTASTGGERIFAVNSDGTGLKQLMGPFLWVNHVAISGDGSKVAYDATSPPCCSTSNEVGVINFDGSGRKSLAVNLGGLNSGLRMQLSADGSKLLFGDSNRLYATDGSGFTALAVRGGYFSSEPAMLINDGLRLPFMNGAADRFVYAAADDANIQQLATMDVNTTTLGDAPSITSQTLSPASIGLNQANSATVSANVATSNRVTRVSAAVINGGQSDGNVNGPVMFDDGTHGDAVAGDGIYTSNEIRANCCAAVGPRTVRVRAEVRDPGNRRHATSVEFVGPTVVDKLP